jgi:hypothetical protein
MTIADAVALLDPLPDRPAPDVLATTLTDLATKVASIRLLDRAILRSALIAKLESLHIKGAAGLADAALSTAPRAEDDAQQGQALTPVDFTPADFTLTGAAILQNLKVTFETYVSLPPYASLGLALAVVHAHTFAATSVAPIIALTSPTKRCGKTTVMMLASALCPRAVLAANQTPAAVFRSIEKYRPTLFLDEADTAFDASDELRTLFNAGHTKATAMVIRTVGDDHEPRGFSTWCPKWLALIGALPGTLADRAVTIPMQRRAKGAALLRLRQDRLGQHRLQAETIARWAADNLEALKAADPQMPEELNDRQQDNWRPLIAIADLAGYQWPELARKAALALSGEAAVEDDEIGMLLLADLRDIFTRADPDKLMTSVILDDLVKLAERPWSDFKNGKPITARHLAGLLKAFGIKSKVIRVGEDTPRGYLRGDLDPAFERYLSSTPPKTDPLSETSATDAESLTKTAVTHPQQMPLVADGEEGLSARNDSDVADVEDANPIFGPGTENGHGPRVIDTPAKSHLPQKAWP